jgi:cation:H+ antiporter
MEEWIATWLALLSWPILAGIIAGSLAILGKGADLVVEEAVQLSERSGISKVVIGATVVSLGTTTPEAVVSVLAAVQGKPGLALGNAVGSIICDTGLILGVACLISPPRLVRSIVNRQGWIQFGAGCLLVLTCLPWSNLGATFLEGGHLSRFWGFLFLILLGLYLWASAIWAKKELGSSRSADATAGQGLQAGPLIVLKLFGAIAMVVAASWILIPAVAEAAVRLHVPESVIAATLVAFGTSLPELVTAVSAALKGHGELAVGNIVGADILNVFFVVGAAAAVTPGGLAAPPHFFYLYFPLMLLVLVVFRIGIHRSGERLGRPFGLILLGTYVLVTVLSYTTSW